MGRALKPERVLFTRDLPKTRSAKIMRRVIRATYLGKAAGDLSSLENPGAVRAITEASCCSTTCPCTVALPGPADASGERALLNRDENELLPRTGPGTPTGALLRPH